jgi:hypothetical protein
MNRAVRDNGVRKKQALLAVLGVLGCFPHATIRSDGSRIVDGTSTVRCVPTSVEDSTPEAWITAARRSVRPKLLGDSVVRLATIVETSWAYQSDRNYAPYLRAYTPATVYIDPASGIEASVSPGEAVLTGPLTVRLSDRNGTYLKRDTTLVPSAGNRTPAERARMLDPWAVLADWSSEGQQTSHAGRCYYRDEWRETLMRRVNGIPQLLYLDTETAFPVALETRERNYLWGDVRVEYIYSTWLAVAGGFFPIASFRIVDGLEDVVRTVGFQPSFGPDVARIPLVNSPLIRSLPSTPMEATIPGFLRPSPPDTVRVSQDIYVLKNPGYSEVVALVADTIFVLDATQAEARARADFAWAAKLFGANHPIVVIVTDAAWPHVAGVRFWVAHGATIVTQRDNEGFIRRVIEQRWTLDADEMERSRAKMALRLILVDDTTAFANNRVLAAHINGAAAEGALMVFFRADRFLWASDFIQDIDHPTLYATDVWRAVRRHALSPDMVGAEHIPLVEWSRVDSLARASVQ